MEEASARRVPVRLSPGVVPEIPLQDTERSGDEEHRAHAGVLCEWKKAEIIELVVMEDHVRLVVVIPPRISVSELMGILKGKTAIRLLRRFSRAEAASLLGEQVLEPWVLREHSRHGRREDSSLCEVPRGQRKKGRGRPKGIRPLLEAKVVPPALPVVVYLVR